MPVELVKLKHLKTLDLSRNRLGGAIHEEMHFLENLEILDFSVNRFSSTLPSEIGLLNGLHTFNIAQNGISGIFPIEICNVKMLQFISVKQNLMHGDLDLIDGLTDLGELSSTPCNSKHTNHAHQNMLISAIIILQDRFLFSEKANTN